jgi:hypothetical protein
MWSKIKDQWFLYEKNCAGLSSIIQQIPPEYLHSLIFYEFFKSARPFERHGIINIISFWIFEFFDFCQFLIKKLYFILFNKKNHCIDKNFQLINSAFSCNVWTNFFKSRHASWKRCWKLFVDIFGVRTISVLFI